MKFIKAKKKNKQTEQLIHLIEMYGTLRLQNEFLHNKIKELEQRVTDLEISKRVGF